MVVVRTGLSVIDIFLSLQRKIYNVRYTYGVRFGNALPIGTSSLAQSGPDPAGRSDPRGRVRHPGPDHAPAGTGARLRGDVALQPRPEQGRSARWSAGPGSGRVRAARCGRAVERCDPPERHLGQPGPAATPVGVHAADGVIAGASGATRLHGRA